MASQSELTRARVKSAWLFLLPMLVVLAIVAGWPLLRTIWFGFTDAKLSTPTYKFIGFGNYLGYAGGHWFGLLTQGNWWRSVWNTVFFSFVSVVLETVLGTIVALVLNANFRGRAIVRAAVLVPWAIPTIVSAKMWLWMLNDQNGIVNHIFQDTGVNYVLQSLGLISNQISWTTGSIALWTVIMVDVWKTTPFMALLILAALQMLPSDCYEAAKVDGIHPVKVFFKVTLPLIRPALMVAVVFRALDALRIFDLIYVLTPNNDYSMSMSGFARQQLYSFFKTGYGSAAATLLFLIIGLITVVAMTAGKVRVSEDAVK
ncbi:ABC transporter permease [Labrys miyagiensis]